MANYSFSEILVRTQLDGFSAMIAFLRAKKRTSPVVVSTTCVSPKAAYLPTFSDLALMKTKIANTNTAPVIRPCMYNLIINSYLLMSLLISRNLSQTSNNKTTCTMPIISIIAIINSDLFQKI